MADQVYLGSIYLNVDPAVGGLVPGDVVIRDATTGAAVKRTTSANDPKVAGIVLSGGPQNTQIVIVTVAGVRVHVRIASAAVVAIGDALVTSTVGGLAKVDNSPSAQGVFAIAVTAKAADVGTTVECQLVAFVAPTLDLDFGSAPPSETIGDAATAGATGLMSDAGHRHAFPTTQQPAAVAGVGTAVTYKAGNSTGAAGGPATFAAGDATGGNAAGGAATFDAGAKSGSGTDGIASLGTVHASAVNIGRTGKTSSVVGTLRGQETWLGAATTLALVNGANNDVDLQGTPRLHYRITGPTAPFSTTGLIAVGPEQLIIVHNPTAFAWTISNNSGSSSAQHRIITQTGADVVLTGPCSAIFLYDSNTNTWLLVATQSLVVIPAAPDVTLADTWREYYVRRGRVNLALAAKQTSHYWDDFHYAGAAGVSPGS